MRVFLNVEIGVLSGCTVDPFEQHTGEPAPEGFSPETWQEWVVNQTDQSTIEMVLDAAEANMRRNPDGPAPE